MDKVKIQAGIMKSFSLTFFDSIIFYSSSLNKEY